MKLNAFGAVMALIVFAGCTAPEPLTYMVEYVVVGYEGERAGMTMETPAGSTQRDGVLPWKYGPFRASSGDFVYISAQADTEHGALWANITLDGETWKTNFASGAYVIATSSGSLP